MSEFHDYEPEARTRAAPPLRLAVRFEPDGYVIDRPKLMGRQSAGNGFLRAAATAARGSVLACCTPLRRSAETFDGLVRGASPDTATTWIAPGDAAALRSVGTLYNPDARLRPLASLRLRAAVDAWSLVGVTHTTASEFAMETIASLPTAPLMPWDALICTSRSVLSTVDAILGEANEYLAWRCGLPRMPWLPRLPVIPLGIHAADFRSDAADKARGRAALGIGADEIVLLFVGRLSFYAKAHPHPMYRAAEDVARRTGKRIVLLQCGWFANAAIEEAFKHGAETFAPSVRSIIADGRNAALRGFAWAAGDIFLSLSDNVQETFGLAPIEAMAAGLPVVVSDWDGYRETVLHGVEGFRIPTLALAEGFGQETAADFESGVLDYDRYCAVTSSTVSVDHAALTEALIRLVLDPDLRVRMGRSGRARAERDYDWSVIMARYSALFAELGAVRAVARTDESLARLVTTAPRSAPNRPDPYKAFARYPSRRLQPDTPLEIAGTREELETAMRHPLYRFPFRDDGADAAREVHAALGKGARNAREVAVRTGLPITRAITIAAQLAKVGVIAPAERFEIPAAGA